MGPIIKICLSLSLSIGISLKIGSKTVFHCGWARNDLWKFRLEIFHIIHSQRRRMVIITWWTESCLPFACPPIVSKSGRFVCGLSLWVVEGGLLYVLRLCKINLSESTSLFHHFLIPFHFIRSNKFVILADANNRVLLYVIVSQTSVSTSSLSRLGWRWAQWLSVDSIFTHFQTTATNLSISPLLDVNPIWYGDEE